MHSNWFSLMIYWRTDVKMTSSLTLFKILYYIKQIDSKLLCICSVTDHRGRQNVVRTSVTHSTAPRVPLFWSYHILTSSVIYYWTDARQLGIYLLNGVENNLVSKTLSVSELALYGQLINRLNFHTFKEFFSK